MIKRFEISKILITFILISALICGHLPALAHSQYIGNNVIAWDSLDFSAFSTGDRVEINTDIRYRNGGYGWRSNWTTSSNVNENEITGSRNAVYINGKYYFNPVSVPGFIRRWFNDIDTTKEGSYTFEFTTLIDRTTPNANNELGACYYIGSGDKSVATSNIKLWTGIKWFTENDGRESGAYPVLYVSGKQVIGNNKLELGRTNPYTFTLTVDTNADSADVFSLNVKPYGTSNNNAEVLTINETYEETKLSYIVIESRGYGQSYFSDFLIKDNNNLLDVESIRFIDKNKTTLDFYADASDSIGAEAIITNRYDTEKTATLYIAMYKGDALKGVSLEKKPLKAGEEATFTAMILEDEFPDDFLTGDYSVKAFLLEDNLVPFDLPHPLRKEILYIASDAHGNGDGSADNPFTISEAIANAKYRTEKGDKLPTYELFGGDYYIDSTVNIANYNFGSEGNPFILRAKQGEAVNFIGGISIPVKEASPVTTPDILDKLPETAHSSVKQVSLSDYGLDDVGEQAVTGAGTEYYKLAKIPYNDVIPYEVMFNKRSMTLARYPNDDFTTVGTILNTGSDVKHEYDNGTLGEIVAPTFTLNPSETSKISHWADAEYMTVTGYFGTVFADITIPVSSVNSADNSITLSLPSAYGVYADEDTTKNKFFVSNLIEELDTPGEYYIDRDTNILYFYPDAADGELYISAYANKMFSFTKADNIVFDGIGFYGGRTNIIEMSECENILFENCTLSGCAESAIVMSGCKDCRISSCDIYDTGSESVILDGGDYTTLSAGNNIVENSHFTGFGRIKRSYSPAVRLNKVGNIARNNEIHDSGGSAITFNGNDHLIEYNEIYDVVKEVDDAAAIYAYIGKTTRGTVIKHNYIHDLYSNETSVVGACAVYTDARRDGTTVTNNLFENIQGAAYLLNCGRDNTFTNNICINVGKVLHYPRVCEDSVTEEKLAKYSLYDGGIHTTMPYAKYPHLANILNDNPLWSKYNVIKDNVVIDSSSDINLYYGIGATDAKIALNGDIIVESVEIELEQAGFKDYKNKDYTLEASSPIYSELKDFVPINFKNVGRE